MVLTERISFVSNNSNCYCYSLATAFIDMLRKTMTQLYGDLMLISQRWAGASQQYIDHSTTVGQAFSISEPDLVYIIQSTTKDLIPHYLNVSQVLTSFRSQLVSIFTVQ